MLGPCQAPRSSDSARPASVTRTATSSPLPAASRVVGFRIAPITRQKPDRAAFSTSPRLRSARPVGSAAYLLPPLGRIGFLRGSTPAESPSCYGSSIQQEAAAHRAAKQHRTDLDRPASPPRSFPRRSPSQGLFPDRARLAPSPPPR